jgi:hypothetical protein
MFVHGIGEHALLIDSLLLRRHLSKWRSLYKPKMKLPFEYRIPLKSFRTMGFIEDASHCDQGEGG